MDPVSCRMRLESLLTIGLYIRQDAFQLWLRFLFRPVLFLYLYNVTPQTFVLIRKNVKTGRNSIEKMLWALESGISVKKKEPFRLRLVRENGCAGRIFCAGGRGRTGRVTS